MLLLTGGADVILESTHICAHLPLPLFCGSLLLCAQCNISIYKSLANTHTPVRKHICDCVCVCLCVRVNPCAKYDYAFGDGCLFAAKLCQPPVKRNNARRAGGSGLTVSGGNG